jgi:hypothetical protein
MDDDAIANAIRSLEEHVDRGMDQFRKQMAPLKERLASHELWAAIDANAGIPGVSSKAKELRERLRHLCNGEVVLRWRPEVYEHDRELLKALQPPEVFRAAVPPLDKDSFDDADFLEFIKAQKGAAKKRSLSIERIYMFKDETSLQQRLDDAVIRKHMDDLHNCSRHMKLFAVVAPTLCRSDFVLFGDTRCSISRGDVDVQKYAQFNVLYTSRPDALERCKENWDRLKDNATPYEEIIRR